MIEHNLFYFVSAGNYSICDLKACLSSDRTFDIKLFDLANNEQILEFLQLHYLQGNFGSSYNYIERAKFFCDYLSSFKQGKEAEIMYSKTTSNPTVRI